MKVYHQSGVVLWGGVKVEKVEKVGFAVHRACRVVCVYVNININIRCYVVRFVYPSATRARLRPPYLGPCASSVLRQARVVAVFNVNVSVC